MTEKKTYEEKLALMSECIGVERSRLEAVGNRPAAAAMTELLEHPTSVVRMYDLLTKGIGNA